MHLSISSNSQPMNGLNDVSLKGEWCQASQSLEYFANISSKMAELAAFCCVHINVQSLFSVRKPILLKNEFKCAVPSVWSYSIADQNFFVFYSCLKNALLCVWKFIVRTTPAITKLCFEDSRTNVVWRLPKEWDTVIGSFFKFQAFGSSITTMFSSSVQFARSWY